MKEADLIKNIQRDWCTKCKAKLDGKNRYRCKSCWNSYSRSNYSKNREREIARSTKWNKDNKEKVAANMRRCRAKDPEKYRKYYLDWKSKNKDKVRLWDHNKRAKRRAAGDNGYLPAKLWSAIKYSFFNRCFYCLKEKKLTIDHYVPLSRGGIHHGSNIVPACLDCNTKKNNKLPEEFFKLMRYM